MNGWLCPFWASHTPVDGEKLAFFVSALTLTVKKNEDSTMAVSLTKPVNADSFRLA